LGQEFELVSYRRTWDEQRLYYHDEEGQLRALPVVWTSMAPVDPFRMISGGRSWFRAVDLVELVVLIKRLKDAV
jgi:hypothetical protein